MVSYETCFTTNHSVANIFFFEHICDPPPQGRVSSRNFANCILVKCSGFDLFFDNKVVLLVLKLSEL